MTPCIRCRRNPAKLNQLCIPCWAQVVYGEPDRLPPFPPLSELLRRIETPMERYTRLLAFTDRP